MEEPNRARYDRPRASLLNRRARRDVRRLDGRCVYCGLVDPGKLTIDHIIPLAHGGEDAAFNAVAACGPCNIGVRGRLFEVCTNFAVTEQRGYGVGGYGREPAIGALYATRGAAPRRRLRLALEAAVRHSAYVQPPFTIRRLKG